MSALNFSMVHTGTDHDSLVPLILDPAICKVRISETDMLRQFEALPH